MNKGNEMKFGMVIAVVNRRHAIMLWNLKNSVPQLHLNLGLGDTGGMLKQTELLSYSLCVEMLQWKRWWNVVMMCSKSYTWTVKVKVEVRIIGPIINTIMIILNFMQ